MSRDYSWAMVGHLRTVAFMMIRRTMVGGLVALAFAVSACGGGSDDDGSGASAPADATVEATSAQGDAVGSGGTGTRSALDIAATSIVRVQSQTYESYEVDGDSVRLMVRDGVPLDGSECLIIESATGVDHPDATWVLVERDGTETPC